GDRHAMGPLHARLRRTGRQHRDASGGSEAAPGCMTNLSRSDIDKAEGRDFALGPGPKRPRDAATLILLDSSGGDLKILMGRRHAKHAFMPGKFVFPGGRTDRGDSRIVPAGDLDPLELAKLQAGRITASRARSIALSAVR